MRIQNTIDNEGLNGTSELIRFISLRTIQQNTIHM